MQALRFKGIEFRVRGLGFRVQLKMIDNFRCSEIYGSLGGSVLLRHVRKEIDE